MDRVKAILWDGNKQINGELILTEERIRFEMVDFGGTDLEFDLDYQEVVRVGYHKLYDISTRGLAIESRLRRVNVFIVEHPTKIKRAIDMRCARR